MADSDATDRAGTVGAVALDGTGRLAAATSTGGMANKTWGRVGDSPIIGEITFNTPGMYRGRVVGDEEPTVAIWEEV